MTRARAQQRLGVTILLLASCWGCSQHSTPFEWPLPEGFPPPSVPADNPMTTEKVELGRHLFYDTRLSANNTQACGTCHQQQYAFAEPQPVAIGSTGEAHRRNTLALVNVAFNATLTWSHPQLIALERQHLIPMFGEAPIELGITGHEQEVLARFQRDTRYQTLFAAAFPDAEKLTYEYMVKALASFVRSLISVNSPFDRYAYGYDDSALSESARRGLNLFFSERLECHHCHGGFNFSQSSTHQGSELLERPFHNTGLYNLADGGDDPDQGLFEFSGDPADRGKFRAPTLRNISYTAPYMHDGSLATLAEVVDFYAAGGRQIGAGPRAGDGRNHPNKSIFVRGFELSTQDRDDLLAFLHALADPDFISNPAWADPFASEHRRLALSPVHSSTEGLAGAEQDKRGQGRREPGNNGDGIAHRQIVLEDVVGQQRGDGRPPGDAQ